MQALYRQRSRTLCQHSVFQWVVMHSNNERFTKNYTQSWGKLPSNILLSIHFLLEYSVLIAAIRDRVFEQLVCIKINYVFILSSFNNVTFIHVCVVRMVIMITLRCNHLRINVIPIIVLSQSITVVL